MGNYLGNQSSEILPNEEKEKRGKKRKYEDSTDDDEAEKIQETLLNTPKKYEHFWFHWHRMIDLDLDFCKMLSDST